MSSSLGIEFAFAMIVTALVGNIALIVKIRFGTDIKITHNTTRPYFLSMYLLCFALMEVTAYLISLHYYFPNDWAGFVGFMRTNYFFKSLITGCICAKFSLALAFILARTYEHNTLHFFIMY